MATKLNKLLTGHTITDELFTRANSTALGLEHDTIRTTADLEIWTGAGKTGTKLTITTDYTVSDTDTALSTEAGVTIYTKVAIVNGTYQNVSLYANYKTIGDYNDADDVNTLYLNKSLQTITGAYTVLTTDKTILVNTNNALTITVPASLPIGFELEVQRVSSGLTTNAVTLSFTGETIYTAATIALFGNGTAKTARYCERFVVRKITASTWELVAGEDSGANANGVYTKSYTKNLKARLAVTTASFASGVNAYAWTLPTTRIGTGGLNLIGNVIFRNGVSVSYTNTVTPIDTSNTTTANFTIISGAAQALGVSLFLDDQWIA